MKNTLLMKLLIGTLMLAAGLLPAGAHAELTVASPFTDNAVLQRDVPVPVWGTADAGATVTVAYADQRKSAVTGPDRRWTISLDPMTGSFTPEELSVTCPGQASIAYDNVVVGEVWICSGQSNMYMGVGRVPAAEALLPTAENIRSFTVKQTVAFTEQDSCEGQWVTQHPDSAVAFSFAYFLEDAADVPVGIIHASWGSSSLEGWMPRDVTDTLPHFKKLMDAFDADQANRENITAIIEGQVPWDRKSDIFLRTQPNILYNAMIHPLVPYACRGVVWYQGERNTGSLSDKSDGPWKDWNAGMTTYDEALTAWIQRYRQEWDREDLHLLVVMLPGFAKTLPGGPQDGANNPAARSWAWMRESQLEVLDLPHTAVANTIDLGHPTNIHPTDKLPIGQRLALLAAHDTLGHDIVAHGPMMKTVERQGDRLVVHFEHAQGLTTQDGNAPTAFWLADDSGQWVRADAELAGDTVILSSAELARPLYVRYAFTGKPTVNLVNEAGLPAYPFRTDTFDP